MLRGDDFPIPYAATYAIPLDFSFPKEFKVADFRGLLFCHIVKGDRVYKLSSYWLDKETFTLFSDRFQRELGLPGPESRALPLTSRLVKNRGGSLAITFRVENGC